MTDTPTRLIPTSPTNIEELKRTFYFANLCQANSGREKPPIPADLKNKICIVTGTSHPELAMQVADLLDISLHNVTAQRNSCGEFSIRVNDDVTGKDVYIIHSTCGNKGTDGGGSYGSYDSVESAGGCDDGESTDINESLMQLLLMIRRMRLCRAGRITAVIPFFAYSRQDRKTELRVPISASSVAAMIMQMGVDRVLTIDLHSGQIQGYFNSVALDNLTMTNEFAQHCRNQDWFDKSRTAVVSPDASGVDRARALADILEVNTIVTIVKRSVEGSKVEVMQTVGDVRGMICIIMDDLVDTGATLVKACELLHGAGAAKVIACCTHGIMTDPCCEIVNKCECLQSLIVTDTIPQRHNQRRCPKLTVIPTSPLLASAVLYLSVQSSVSELVKGSTVNPKELLKRVPTSPQLTH